VAQTQTSQPADNRAQAVIRKVWATGLYFDHGMEIGLELEVAAPGLAPYPVETQHIISLLTAAQFQPGQRLGLVVDPSNPRRVVITQVLPMVAAAPLDKAV
jgi:hypothetical protein